MVPGWRTAGRMASKVALPEMDFEIPSGFVWGATEGGIKYSGRLDVTVLLAEKGPCPAAAVFTQNTFCAAPVAVSRELLQQSNGMISGCVVNSGCANAATGEEGLRNARKMAAAVGDGSMIVCSTGTIGVQLPMERLMPAIERAASSAGASRETFLSFAKAILTTDTREKIAFAKFDHEGKTVRVLGCAKGSGMMQPNMATMLAYVMTDAEVDQTLLQKLFREINERTLNCVTVDGDTSTNDTACILASGASTVAVTEGGPGYSAFEKALGDVMQSLSRQLARDGEGATKLIEVEVQGAPDFLSARTAAFAVANSPLVKTAVYGRDANWGRIAMALGKSGVSFDPVKVDIRLGDLLLFERGTPLPLDEDAALKVLSDEFVRLEANLHNGSGAATVWTCDLTEKYIEINGSYRT